VAGTVSNRRTSRQGYLVEAGQGIQREYEDAWLQ